MVHNWLHKILNHTVTPPQGVWEDIASQLDKDDAAQASDLTAKMHSYEVKAPAEAFTNIFSALDKDTAAPPAAAERMFTYTVAAPVNAWDNIAAALDANEAVVIPLQKNRRTFTMVFRIAAAAVITALVLLTVVLVTKKTNTAPNNIATEKPNHPSPLIITPETNTATTVLPASETQQENKHIALQQQNLRIVKIQAKEDPVTIEYVKGTEVAALATNPAADKTAMLQNSSGQTPMDISLMNTPNTYISITGPDGQTVKVSSKFSNLIGYLNEKDPATEENLDIIIKESAKWRATFAAWREKMYNNAVAPSLGNFMDIIELSKVLEQKQ